MATYDQIFADYASRERVWHDSNFSRTTRNQFKDRALSAFDAALENLLGRKLPKFSKDMTPTQRAIAAAATRDEATKAYDAAIAKESAKRGGTTGAKFRKYAAKVKGYFDKRVSQLDKAYASSAGSANGNVIGSPSGSQNSGSAPPPTLRNNLVTTTEPDSGGPNLFLWAGVGALIWYFWRK